MSKFVNASRTQSQALQTIRSITGHNQGCILYSAVIHDGMHASLPRPDKIL
jgi:hypothetical protein